jgi:hypothetical protein
MKQRHQSRWLVGVVLVFPLLVVACGGTSASKPAAEPAGVEHVAGTDVYRITLTAETAKRLEVKTATVQRSGSETAIPYAAVLYSPSGEASAYVSSTPLTFLRQAIVVDRIVGNRAVLSHGLAAGTKVATVGVSELYGIETSAGGGQ